MLSEASDEVVAEEGAEVKLVESSRCAEDVSSRPRMPEMDEDPNRKESSCTSDLGSQPPAGTPALVSLVSRPLLKRSPRGTTESELVSLCIIHVRIFVPKLFKMNDCGNRP